MRKEIEEKYETYWRYWDTIGINTEDFDKQMEEVKITWKKEEKSIKGSSKS